MDEPRLEDWIGRQQQSDDIISASPLARLRATLDEPDGAIDAGTVLPPLAHWLYCLPATPRSELGADGHARRGSFLPPVKLPRRMWAGGRFEFLRPLRVGNAMRRTSTITAVTPKRGRSGELVFVSVEHRIDGPDGVALVETQELVYREADTVTATPPPAPDDAAWQEPHHADDVQLFRYSALTFNGHRIHYDRRYATETEGYPGLIVHGPLIATLLARLASRHSDGKPLREFSFRAHSPLFDIAPFSVCGRPEGATGAQLWARDATGRLAMSAAADW